MKAFILIALLFPLTSFSSQYSKSICLQAGLKDLNSLEGDYKKNAVVPTASEYTFTKDVFATISRTESGTYSYSNLKDTFIARTCEINGQLLMELEVSYRLVGFPDQYIKSYSLYVIKQKQNTLKIQELVFNPKKLAANEIPYKIVDQILCQGDKKLLVPKDCQISMQEKLLVVENSNTDFKKLFAIADPNSLVFNFYK